MTVSKKNTIKGQQTMNSCLKIGSLSNDDGDGNDNSKKELGLDFGKTITLHVYHAFLYIS